MKNTGAGKFSRASYDANNQWGIDQVSSFIVSRGFEIIPKRGEDYGIDIAAIRAGEIVYLEAEVKTNYEWTCRDDFKFPTVSFHAWVLVALHIAWLRSIVLHLSFHNSGCVLCRSTYRYTQVADNLWLGFDDANLNLVRLVRDSVFIFKAVRTTPYIDNHHPFA